MSDGTVVCWTTVPSDYCLSGMFPQRSTHQAFIRSGSCSGAYSATFTDGQLSGRGRLPLPFFENWKKCLDFGKKGPDCVHLWAKLSIQNVVSKCFSARLHFIVFMTKCLSKYLSSTKPPLQWKTSGWARALRHYYFCKTLCLKCLTVFWKLASITAQ